MVDKLIIMMLNKEVVMECDKERKNWFIKIYFYFNTAKPDLAMSLLYLEYYELIVNYNLVYFLL